MNDELKRIANAATELRQQSKRRHDEYLMKRMQRWHDIVGDKLLVLLSDKERAVDAVIHEKGAIRCVAIHVLAAHWEIGMNDRYLAVIDDIVRHVDDAEQRSIAIVEIGRLYKGNPENPYRKQLCMHVLDEDCEYSVRHASYIAVFSMAAKDMSVIYATLDEAGEPRKFIIPDDIDIGFVTEFMNR